MEIVKVYDRFRDGQPALWLECDDTGNLTLHDYGEGHAVESEHAADKVAEFIVDMWQRDKVAQGLDEDLNW